MTNSEEYLELSGSARGYTFRPFQIDVASYQLLRDGEPVDLTSKVFDTLVFLVRERHRVVTKEELLTAVWRGSHVTEDSLTHSIWSLRRALGDDAAKPRYVTTIARRGYQFIAPVEEWPSECEVASIKTSVAEATHPPADNSSGSTLQPQVARPERGKLHGRSALYPVSIIGLLFMGAVTGYLFAGLTRHSLPTESPLLFDQPAPPGSELASGGALAPNGKYLAFAAQDQASGQTRLWVRPFDSGPLRALEGTEGGLRPFWSPDSEFIGFFAGGRLKTIRATGGPIADLAEAGANPAGASWGSSGRIVFSRWLAGLSAVSASGGPVTTVTDREQPRGALAWPQFLPDGDHFLYSVYEEDRVATYVGRLSSNERTRLLEADAGAIYSPLGFLLFTRNGVLTGHRFDIKTFKLSGEPFMVMTGNVVSPSMTNGTMLSAATRGLIAFGGATGESELVWFDRSGQRLDSVHAPIPLHNPRLSADQKQVFANTYPPDRPSVWLIDVERGTISRRIPEGTGAIPSADGERLAFTASRHNSMGIFTMPLTGDANAPDDAVLLTSQRKVLTDWTRDGQYLLFHTFSAERRRDLWLLPQTGDKKPRPILDTAADELQGQVSPDGGWLAYVSDESGRSEVYVETFPSGRKKQVISFAGGAEPQWRADGRELFYLAADRSLMSVDVTAVSSFKIGRPKRLFRPRVFGEGTTYRNHYAVTADGQRFLVDMLQDSALAPIKVLVNWGPPAD